MKYRILKKVMVNGTTAWEKKKTDSDIPFITPPVSNTDQIILFTSQS
jgi:hypothetical protein